MKIVGEEVGWVVSDPERGLPSTERVPVMLKEGVDVGPFEYLLAEVGDGVYALIRVTELKEYNVHAEPRLLDLEVRVRAVPSSDAGLPGRFVLANTELVDAFRVRDGRIEPLGPRVLPRSRSPVYKAAATAVRAIMGQARVPVEVGDLVGTPGVRVCIDAEALLRHMVVVGTTGTGKSWFRGLLMERLYDKGIPQVIIDPMADYLQSTRELGGVVLVPGENYRPRLDVLSTSSFLGLVGDTIPTPFQRVVAAKAFELYKDESRRALVPLPPEKLPEYVDKAASLYRAKEDTRENVMARLEEFLKSVGIFGTGFCGSLAGETWERLINEKKLVTVDARLDDLQLQVLITSILEELITLREAKKIPPLVLSFDEAHRIAPRGVRGLAGAELIKQLIRYGRHKGIGIIAITQFPDSVDVELIRLPAIRVVFALDVDQIGAIKGMLMDLPEELKAKLPKLECGTAFISGTADVVRHTVYVRIDSNRKTTHGGVTPSLIDAGRSR